MSDGMHRLTLPLTSALQAATDPPVDRLRPNSPPVHPPSRRIAPDSGVQAARVRPTVFRMLSDNSLFPCDPNRNTPVISLVPRPFARHVERDFRFAVFNSPVPDRPPCACRKSLPRRPAKIDAFGDVEAPLTQAVFRIHWS